MYNPMQSRLDYLNQQKQMIEQQMQNLQQYAMPPININNNMTQPMPTSFDFNGKWVQNEIEAKGVVNNNLPLILFDKNEPIFYMKNLDGSFKKFHFNEIIEQPAAASNDNRIDALEAKLEVILDALNQTNTNTPEKPKQASEGSKQVKGGKQND